MIKHLKKIDTFGRNMILVFAGTTIANFLNLLYQLIIAHKLSPSDFAAFNSLLAIFILISTPLSTLQQATAKYCAEFNARNELSKVKGIFSGLLKKSLLLALVTLVLFYFLSFFLTRTLKIPSVACGYILAAMLATSWTVPIFAGAVQGLELFKWLVLASLVGGLIKLASTFVFLQMGFNAAGALGAFLISVIVGLAIYFKPLGKYFSWKENPDRVYYKEIFWYLFPLAAGSFCFIALSTFDIVLVKYYFTPEQSGVYSLAQMVGKIFLFLPGAISLVMFPRAAGLKAQNMDTSAVLKRSLIYGGILCVIAIAVYNLIPGLILKILTGKALPQSIFLG